MPAGAQGNQRVQPSTSAGFPDSVTGNHTGRPVCAPAAADVYPSESGWAVTTDVLASGSSGAGGSPPRPLTTKLLVLVLALAAQR